MGYYKYSFVSFFLLASIVIVTSCATTNSANAKREVYEEDFNTMVKVVERAIRGSALGISFAEQSGDGNKYTIIINSNAYVNNQSVQTDQGKVEIIKVNEKQTKVVISNPEYHFSVPRYQRKDYKRILTNRINDILNN